MSDILKSFTATVCLSEMVLCYMRTFLRYYLDRDWGFTFGIVCVIYKERSLRSFVVAIKHNLVAVACSLVSQLWEQYI